MVEAEGHLKLLSTSILDMCKVFEHIDMLSTGIQYHPYTVTPTLLLGSDFGVLGHLWSQNDVILPWLRLTVTSNCFPHPYKAMSLTPKYRKAIQPSDRARGALWNNCCFAKTMLLFDKWNISEKPKISTHQPLSVIIFGKTNNFYQTNIVPKVVY